MVEKICEKNLLKVFLNFLPILYFMDFAVISLTNTLFTLLCHATINFFNLIQKIINKIYVLICLRKLYPEIFYFACKFFQSKKCLIKFKSTIKKMEINLRKKTFNSFIKNLS